MSTLRTIERPGAHELPADPRAFLAWLGAPTAIRVPGRGPGPARVVTTLLHGNEPSGFHAIHRWLREGREPEVETLLVVANVEAALAPPGFAYRMLPGRADLNRCFLGPFEGPEGRLAREILDALRAVRPAAVVDIHNNSGHNPPYGVGVSAGRPVLELVSLFGDRFVCSHLRLGALMEAIREVPSATVEVGRSGDPRADENAFGGLVRFLEQERVIGSERDPSVRILDHPLRVCVVGGTSLDIAHAPEPGVDLTIEGDLDRHNFEEVAAGTRIGWTRLDRIPLEVVDEQGRDRAEDYFELEDGEVRTRRPMIPIMISTDPRAVEVDCLFYAVHEPPGRGAAI